MECQTFLRDVFLYAKGADRVAQRYKRRIVATRGKVGHGMDHFVLVRQNPRTMYRRPYLSRISPVKYKPNDDPDFLRGLVLRALDPEVQKVFHQLEAARTPDEWVALETSLPWAIANLLAPASEDVNAKSLNGPWPFPVAAYCPVCKMLLADRANEQNARERVRSHVAMAGPLPPCATLGELLCHFERVIRPRLFSDAAVAEARVRYARTSNTEAADEKSSKPARVAAKRREIAP